MDETIILIGPMGAGKSTVGTCLAKKLEMDYVALDELQWDYYAEIGFDIEDAKQIIDSEKGFAGFLEYIKPFEAHAVERVLAECRGCVLDFGAGHVVHRDPQLFARVNRVFTPQPNVILLLPSADLDESVDILNERILRRIDEIGEEYRWAIEENKHFVQHPSLHQLAKMTVYTKGKLPEETCAEIAQLIGS